MESKRKVIAQISEYERKPRRHPIVGYYMHRVAQTKTFDNYEEFEAHREQLEELNRDRTRETVIIIDWWWYCD